MSCLRDNSKKIYRLDIVRPLSVVFFQVWFVKTIILYWTCIKNLTQPNICADPNRSVVLHHARSPKLFLLRHKGANAPDLSGVLWGSPGPEINSKFSPKSPGHVQGCPGQSFTICLYGGPTKHYKIHSILTL